MNHGGSERGSRSGILIRKGYLHGEGRCGGGGCSCVGRKDGGIICVRNEMEIMKVAVVARRDS